MTYDPNWFYSSLAQSAAAIVGLIGAILIPRLQAQIEAVRKTSDALRVTLQNFRDTPTSLANNILRGLGFENTTIADIGRAIAESLPGIERRRDVDLFGNFSNELGEIRPDERRLAERKTMAEKRRFALNSSRSSPKEPRPKGAGLRGIVGSTRDQAGDSAFASIASISVRGIGPWSNTITAHVMRAP